MNAVEFAKELAEREGLTIKKAAEITKTVVSIIRGEVQATGRFAMADLGIFTLRERKAWQGRLGKVPAHKAVHFRPAAGFKRAVNLR